VRSKPRAGPVHHLREARLRFETPRMFEHSTLESAWWVAIESAPSGLTLRTRSLKRRLNGTRQVSERGPGPANMAPERRAAFLERALSRNSLIIEDDYDAEFRYARMETRSLVAVVAPVVQLLELPWRALPLDRELRWRRRNMLSIIKRRHVSGTLITIETIVRARIRWVMPLRR
jgi:hypothetical protein